MTRRGAAEGSAVGVSAIRPLGAEGGGRARAVARPRGAAVATVALAWRHRRIAGLAVAATRARPLGARLASR